MSQSIEPEDSELFRTSVGPVRPVRHDRHVHPRTPPRPRPLFLEADERAVLIDMMSEAFEPVEYVTGDELIYLREGVQPRVLKRLRRGQIGVGAELDLHGMTVAMAHEAVAAFLHECRRRRIQCVRVIHGKGLGSRHQGPVLKGKVGNWLRQRNEVLAYCSARPYDGGTGAIYVLLKRP